jgi:uncharacterized integral membrane protein (TIGR00697 family)
MKSPKGRSFSLLEPVIAAFVGLIIVSNIVSQKFLTITLAGLPVSMDMGTLLLFPLTYIFGDVLTEVFGFAVSRRVIWYGFGMNALAALVFSAAVAMPWSPDFTSQKEFALVLGAVPGLVVASLAGFWFGSFTNDFIMARMKVWMVRWDPTHRWLPLRTIGSTLVGEFVDTCLFVTVGTLAGVFPRELFLSLVISQWIIKVGIETLLTPLTVLVCRLMKAHEAKDIVGVDSYNPFDFGGAGGTNLFSNGQAK